MITIAGAGVAGLASAYELASRGARVILYEQGEDPSANSCSWLAGGMLAPWCEAETAEPEVVRLGVGAGTTRDRVEEAGRRMGAEAMSLEALREGLERKKAAGGVTGALFWAAVRAECAKAADLSVQRPR